MSRQVIEKAWELLEKGTPLQECLLALGDLELWLAAEDDDALERLKGISRKVGNPLSAAIDHALVRFRRKKQDWDVITQNPERRAQGQISRVLREANEILGGPDPMERTAFVERCAKEERFEIGPVLTTRLLMERDPGAAAAMARALGKLGTEACLASLKQASRRPEAEVRLGATYGLAYQRGREALMLLIERLGDKEKEIVWATLDLLETFPLREVLDLLEQIPPGRLVDVQIGAVEYLKGFLGNHDVVQLLRRWLPSPNDRLSAEALVALASIRDDAAVNRFQELAGDPDPRRQQILSIARAAYESGEAPRRR